MKTILRIIIILVVASVVAGAFFLVLNNSSALSNSNEGGQPPAMTSADGQTMQPMQRPEEGERDDGPIAQGLSGVGISLLKLTAITLVVLVLEKGFSQLSRLRLKFEGR